MPSDRAQLFVDGGDGLFEHLPVGGGAGTLEVAGSSGAGKFKSVTACPARLLIRREGFAERFHARRLLLLELDHLRLEPSRHTIIIKR